MGWTKTAIARKGFNINVKSKSAAGTVVLAILLAAVLVLASTAIGGLIIWAGFAIIVPQWGVTFWMTWIGWAILAMIVGLLRGSSK